MPEHSVPQHILISGGEGDLACALQKKFSEDNHQVHAPGRKAMDVRNEAQVEAYFSKLERLDILIANAGLTRDGALTGLSSEDFAETVNANLRGAFLCSSRGVEVDGEATQWPHPFYRFTRSTPWYARTERLCGSKGWIGRPGADPRQGIWRAQYPVQCGATRFSRDTNDGGTFRRTSRSRATRTCTGAI